MGQSRKHVPTKWASHMYHDISQPRCKLFFVWYGPSRSITRFQTIECVKLMTIDVVSNYH